MGTTDTGRETEAVLQRVPRAAAHRVIERWVGSPLLEGLREEDEAYSIALAGRLEGFRLARLVVSTSHALVSPPREGGRLVAMDCDHEEEQFVVYPGASEVHAGDGKVYPSLAHLLLEGTLTRAELAALAASETWRPSRAVEVVAPLPPLALDRRSRGWAIVGSTLMVCLMPMVVAVAALTAAPRLAWMALALSGMAAAGVFVASVQRLYEVLVLEPRVRDLVVDDEGFTLRGARTRWMDVRLARGRLVFALTHADGRRFEIPRSLFRDPVRAERVLRARTRA